MRRVFVGASAFKYAKDLVAWKISKVSTMTQTLGEDDSFVWNKLTACDKKTLWLAWYDMCIYEYTNRGGGGEGMVWIVGRARACACACVALNTF